MHKVYFHKIVSDSLWQGKMPSGDIQIVNLEDVVG